MNLELLEKILKTPSVSGYELYLQKLLIKELKNIDDEVVTHHSYNVTHIVNPKSNIKVMLLAHIDEIGLIINQILDNGICKLTNAGSIKPQMYIGQKVNVVKYDNNTFRYIPGVIGYTPNYNQETLKVEDLNLDLGTSSKEETLNLINVGDCVIQNDTYTLLENNLLSSRALDDKIGIFICCEVLKRIKETSNVGVYFTATVGEETTGRGAAFATNSVNPTCSITLDVGSSSDVKYKNNFTRDVSLGKGPIITITSNANKILLKRLEVAAQTKNIPLQYVVEYSKTYTDFDTVYKLNNGIPSELISIPLRYMHSAVEVCSLNDVEYIIELLVEFIENLTSDVSFNEFECE